jgi:hypothetical protein
MEFIILDFKRSFRQPQFFIQTSIPDAMDGHNPDDAFRRFNHGAK